MDDDAVDFVMAAWREEGRWRLDVLPARTGVSVSRLMAALAAHAGEGGVIGMVSVAEDFFVLVRLAGQQTRYLLSDIGAAVEWPLAAGVLDQLGVSIPPEDTADFAPAGDLEIVADLGMAGDEISMLAQDIDLYPDEVLGSIAARLGFGEQYDIASGAGPS
ncbi:MAG: tRNA adenosine deaminase-associated protein [Actinomycetes bacterium]